jgi:hypothetical protein
MAYGTSEAASINLSPTGMFLKTLHKSLKLQKEDVITNIQRAAVLVICNTVCKIVGLQK